MGASHPLIEQVAELFDAVRRWARAGPSHVAVPVPPDGVPPTLYYIDLVFAYALAALGESEAAWSLCASARTGLGQYPADSDRGIAAGFLGRVFEFRIRQALDRRTPTDPLPDHLHDELDDLGRQSRDDPKCQPAFAHWVIERLLAESRILDPAEERDPYLRFVAEYGGLNQFAFELTRERDHHRRAVRIRELLGSGSPGWAIATEEQFNALRTCLPLVARCDGEFVVELLQAVPDAVRRDFAEMKDLPRKRGALLTRAAHLAATFGHRELLIALASAAAYVVANAPAEHRDELISMAAAECFRGFRKLGMRGEAADLATRLGAVADDRAGSASLPPEKRLRAMRAKLTIAGGWLTGGLVDWASPILQAADAEILAPQQRRVPNPDFTFLLRDYVSAIGNGPAEQGLRQLNELFRAVDPNKTPIAYTTAPFYSRNHLNVAEAVAFAVLDLLKATPTPLP